MEAAQPPPSKKHRLVKLIVRKAVTLSIVVVVFGWIYGWAMPWAYPPNRPVGFGYGLLHGALMPISLPSLVFGRDVRIFDENNSGRLYKIGYICGVDVCGLIFIGPLFWRPRGPTSASSGKSQ